MSRGVVSRMENARVAPTLSTVEKLLEGTDVTLSELAALMEREQPGE